MKYNDNGTPKEIKFKVADTLPIGAVVDYNGETIPDGWELESNIVWQNNNDNNSFGSQTINLTNNNYKYYEIYYKLIKTVDYIQSVKVLVNKKSVISISAIPGFLGEGRTRRIETITNSQINFSDCTKGTTSTVDNDTIIPCIIVGYN